jgi:hypothetical protein
MRRNALLAGRPSALLITCAFGWLALALPAAAASPTATPAATAAPSASTLTVTAKDSIDSSAYPSVSVNLSIVDSVTSRPESSLNTSNVSLSPAGKVTGVSPSTADGPAAYILDIDTSGSMGDSPQDNPGAMVRAKALATAFVAHLGANDYVKLLTFDVGTSVVTGWMQGNDPALADTIKNKVVAKPDGKTGMTNLTEGIVQATNLANANLPAGVQRREVVMITDADYRDNDLPTSPADLKLKLQNSPPFFVVGLLPASKVGSILSGDLTDIGIDTGGKYQTSDSTKAAATDAATDAATLFQPAWASTKSTWKVAFSTDPIPSDKSATEQLTIHDAVGASGSATLTYPSTGLFSKSQINVAGLANGASVTRDQTVTASASGYTAWQGGYQIQLFYDCDPQPQAAKCIPTQSSNTATLTWPITVATMPQGGHHVYVRLAVTYNGVQYFSPTTTLNFTRSGTTWNIAAVMLVGGIAVLLIGAFFIASRRRGAPSNQRRAQ